MTRRGSVPRSVAYAAGPLRSPVRSPSRVCFISRLRDTPLLHAAAHVRLLLLALLLTHGCADERAPALGPHAPDASYGSDASASEPASAPARVDGGASSVLDAARVPDDTGAARALDAAAASDARAPVDAGSAQAGDSGPLAAGARGTPPQTWKEHWFEHTQTLELVGHNDWVALYFDAQVDRKQASWLLPFMTRVWQYTVQHYGPFTDGVRDGRLYAIYHQGKYSGGHPSTYFDASHDFRNVSDVGPGPFPDGNYAISTHEVAHVVEGASRGFQGSPAFGLWKDSKWAEFYQYDLYVGLGLTQEAERVHAEFSAKADDFPRANTHWFRDWFYPLWRDHGGVEVMANYFRLLAAHYRKQGTSYGRGMNFGEFVHFMSGAAGKSLKPLAENAFGWPEAREAELVRARSEFPQVRY